MKKTTKKPWCTYGSGWPPCGFGKIEEESEDSLRIRYSEGQQYSIQLWENNPVYIKRYETLEEAAIEYQDGHNNGTNLRMDHPINDDGIKEMMHWKFPTYFKEKKKIKNGK